MKNCKALNDTGKHNNSGLLIIYLVTAILFALLFYSIPFTMDDWSWGGAIGEQRLRNCFSGYNGRYLGNLTVYVLTRSRVLRVIVMTLVTQLMCVQATRLSVRKVTVFNYLLTVTLISSCILPAFISPRLNLFSQTIGWVSGFSNYIMPMIFLLAYAGSVRRCCDNPDITSGRAENIAMLICGVCSCLFLETITIFCVIAGATVILLLYRKGRKCLPQVMFFIGSLAGTSIMLSNSSYRDMLKRAAVDKAVTDSDFRAIGFVDKSVFDEFTVKLGLSPRILVLIFILMLMGIAMMFIIPFIITRDKSRRAFLLTQLISIILLTVPLLFANGGHNYIISIRVYFPQFIFTVIYIAALADTIIAERGAAVRRIGRAAAVLAFCCMAISLSVTYSGVYKAYRAADEYVLEQVDANANQIEIIEYPIRYRKFVFMADAFKDREWGNAYRQYYNIAEDTVLIPVEYKSN